MGEIARSGRFDFRRGFDVLIQLYIVYYTLFTVLLTLLFVPDPVLSVLNLVSLVTGAALILAYFILNRPFLPGKPHFPALVIVAAFFVFFGVTILVNRSGDLYGNVKAMLANAIQLLLIFFYLAQSPEEKSRSLIRLAMGTLVALTFVIAAAHIVVVVFDITVRHDIYVYAGFFSNPNNSSVCVVSILCSLLFLRRGRGAAGWWILIPNMALQLIVVVLCRSRACLIMLGVGVVFFALCFLFEKSPGKRGRRLLFVLGLAAAAAVLFLIAQPLMKPVKTGSKATGASGVLDMQQVKQSSNNKRMNFIICGSKVFLQHPVFGVGPRNVASVVKSAYPTVDLQGIEKGGLHNAYLQLLVSNGLMGFLAVLALAAYAAVRIVKTRVYENFYNLAILAGLLAYALFEINVFFVNFPTSLLFWGMLGYSLSLANGESGKARLTAETPAGGVAPAGPA